MRWSESEQGNPLWLLATQGNAFASSSKLQCWVHVMPYQEELGGTKTRASWEDPTAVSDQLWTAASNQPSKNAE
ncbi:unnamed protein product [Caretta caretta]